MEYSSLLLVVPAFAQAEVKPQLIHIPRCAQ